MASTCTAWCRAMMVWREETRCIHTRDPPDCCCDEARKRGLHVAAVAFLLPGRRARHAGCPGLPFGLRAPQEVSTSAAHCWHHTPTPPCFPSPPWPCAACPPLPLNGPARPMAAAPPEVRQRAIMWVHHESWRQRPKRVCPHAAACSSCGRTLALRPHTCAAAPPHASPVSALPRAPADLPRVSLRSRARNTWFKIVCQ